MILDENYEKATIRSYVNLKCDYCDKEFKRVKKSRQRLNKHIDKDSCGSKPCTQQKIEEVNLKLYGCKSIFETTKFKDNYVSYFNDPEFQSKRKETLLKKYGVESPLQSEEIRKKQINTCKELYGVENYFNAPDFVSKSIKTNLEKYGETSSMKTQRCKDKRDKTSIEKYGVKSYAQTDEHKARKKKTCLEKYGVDHTSKLKSNRELAKNTCEKRYGVDNYSKTEECKNKLKEIFNAKYGVPNPLCLKENQIYGKTQESIKKWLNSLGLIFNSTYSILEDKQIDLFNDQTNLAIEYCGLFWHTELSPTPRCKNYHFNKYKTCKEQGIALLTIFEDEWKKKNEQCKSIIKSKLNLHNKIYARKCLIKEIDKQCAQTFYENNHLLGQPSSIIVSYGLFYNQELIGAISLGKHHRKNTDVVLNRLCFKLNTTIIGGFSRLLKQCINYCKKHNIPEIISWSDNRWYEGKSYASVGFILDREFGPDYSYVNFSNCRNRHSKQSFKKSNKLIPVNITEREWCAENGYARIWDCGKKRWKLIIP